MSCDEVVLKRCQRASATKKYLFDFTPALATGETIASVTVSSSPTGLTLAHSESGGKSTVLASGGTPGTTYRVKCTGTSSDAQILPLVIDIEIIPD